MPHPPEGGGGVRTGSRAGHAPGVGSGVRRAQRAREWAAPAGAGAGVAAAAALAAAHAAHSVEGGEGQVHESGAAPHDVGEQGAAAADLELEGGCGDNADDSEEVGDWFDGISGPTAAAVRRLLAAVPS
jgi:hypothetical protein